VRDGSERVTYPRPRPRVALRTLRCFRDLSRGTTGQDQNGQRAVLRSISKEENTQRKAMSMSTTRPATPLVAIGNHGGGPYGEYLLLVLKAYQRLGMIDLRAVVANEYPAADRARLAQGTLRALGMTTPVAVGSDCVRRRGDAPRFDAPYSSEPVSLRGKSLLIEALTCARPRSVELLLTSTLSDAESLFAAHTALCQDRLASVTIMAGAAYDMPAARWVPDMSDNNVTDPRSAVALFARLQNPDWRHVRVRVLSRFAVDDGRVPKRFLTSLAATGHPVPAWLLARTEDAIEQCWRAVRRPPGVLGILPADRDLEWFANTILGGRDPRCSAGDPIWDRVRSVPLFDVVAGVAAVESWYFTAASHLAQANFEVIGQERDTGVRDPDALTRRITELLTVAIHGSNDWAPDK
jgi:hypothetical protein